MANVQPSLQTQGTANARLLLVDLLLQLCDLLLVTLVLRFLAE